MPKKKSTTPRRVTRSSGPADDEKPAAKDPPNNNGMASSVDTSPTNGSDSVVAASGGSNGNPAGATMSAAGIGGNVFVVNPQGEVVAPVDAPSVVSQVPKKRRAKSKIDSKKKKKKGVISELSDQPKLEDKLGFLKDLGLQFSPSRTSGRNPVSSTQRTSILQVALVNGGDAGAVWKFQPEGNYSSWSEKIFNDQNYQVNGYTSRLNFERRSYKWVVAGEEQMNAANYPIRLFVIPFVVLPSHDILLKIGKTICDMVNAEPGNNSVCRVDPANFYWITGFTTYQHMFSTVDCMNRIRTRLGEPAEGWWSRVAPRVQSYFATGTINQGLARALFAPNEMLYPGFQGAQENDDEDDEEDEEEDDEDDEEEEEEGEVKDQKPAGIALAPGFNPGLQAEPEHRVMPDNDVMAEDEPAKLRDGDIEDEEAEFIGDEEIKQIAVNARVRSIFDEDEDEEEEEEDMNMDDAL